MSDAVENPSRDRPADEIEVTPEMIAAGEQALLCELGGAVSEVWHPRDLAISVYRAMEKKCPSTHRRDRGHTR